MTDRYFRLLTLTLFGMIVILLYRTHFTVMDVPEAALAYIEWWRAQPTVAPFRVVMEYAAVIHALWLFSTIGLVFFWSPARYVFVACFVIAIFGESLAPAPVVIPTFSVVLDNVLAVLVGMVLWAMFSGPLTGKFSTNPFKNGSRLSRSAGTEVRY